MCWLVMAGISGYRRDPAQVFRAREFVVEPALNPGCDVMPAGATRLTITDGACSCSFFVVETANNLDESRERQRYERMGWSAAKIERALASKKGANDRPAAVAPIRNAFVDAISELVAAGAGVTLLAHGFNESFDDPFEIVDRAELSLARLRANAGAFPPETLLTIVA